jgi:hypothetical protein
VIEQGSLSAKRHRCRLVHRARWSILLVPSETADASITLESMNMRILWSTLLAASLVGCLASDPQDRTGSPEASGAPDPASATADPSLPDDDIATSTEDLTTGDGSTPQAFGLSFTITCNPPRNVVLNAAANGVVFASAASCKRRNGTLTGPVSKSFPGTGCMADVANCDGVLHCGGC